jgi:POT family proton-dependent oligopeptide transporter
MNPFTIMALAWLGSAIWIAFVILTNRKEHPKALFFLFFIEMWERFSYYGMRALLVLYMTKGFLGYELDKAYGYYGAYGALVYATPLIGGLLAERFLGYRKSILWGAILMAAGEFLLMLPNNFAFLTALSLLIIGNGFFKPNISSMIGKFYAKKDPRRDGAFTIFYMGINIGAFLTGLTCGLVGETYGFQYGFLLAGLGMLIGLGVYLYAISQNILGDKGYAPYEAEELNGIEALNYNKTNNSANILDDKIVPQTDDLNKADVDNVVPVYKKIQNPIAPKIAGFSVEMIIYLLSFAMIPLIWVLIGYNDILDIGLGVVGLGMIVYLIINSFQYEIAQRQRIWVISILFIFSVVFWTFFELAGSALTVFTDKNVIKSDYLTTTMFQSLNPLFIMLFAPVFSWMWVALSKAKLEPPAPVKFGIALILLGLGFMVLNLGKASAVNGMIPAIFMVFLYLLHTIGELALSPVGLSLVTKLSPAQVVGFVMGFWMMASSLAHQAGKRIAQLTVVPEDAPAEESLNLCLEVFTNLGLFAAGAGLLLILASPIVSKWMHGIK